MSHEVHNAELVQAVEPELPPWYEYIAVGLSCYKFEKWWFAYNPRRTPEEAMISANDCDLTHVTIHRLPDPRKPQPAPRVVIDWHEVWRDGFIVKETIKQSIERHARIEVPHE